MSVSNEVKLFAESVVSRGMAEDPGRAEWLPRMIGAPNGRPMEVGLRRMAYSIDGEAVLSSSIEMIATHALLRSPPLRVCHL